jgi:predicted nuclease of predicted toxin-antitoxin system
VFLYLVAMASHKPVQIIYRKKRITLKRGQVSIAYRDLAKKFDISFTKTKTIIKNLVASGNVNQNLIKNLSIYSIVKYDKYQDLPEKKNQNIANRTTTINTILYSIDKNDKSLSSMTDKPKKITIPTLQDLKTKIIEKPREKNEFEIMREKLDSEDYEKWVLRQLNS